MPKKLKSLKSKLFKDQPLTRSSFSRTQLLFFAAIFAAIGGYIIWKSFAATQAAPTLILYSSLDQTYPGESVQVVWEANNATECHANGDSASDYKGNILLVDTNQAQGIQKDWQDSGSGLGTGGSGRSDPLFVSAFANGDSGDSRTFSITCSNGSDSTTRTVTVVKDGPVPTRGDGVNAAFDMSCRPIPNFNDPRDDPGANPPGHDNDGRTKALSPQALDPIIFPNKDEDYVLNHGGNLNEFFGNKTLNKDTTPLDLLKTVTPAAYRDPAKDGWSSVSCSQIIADPDTIETRNGSAYWPPTLYICDGGYNNQDASKCEGAKQGSEDFQSSPGWARMAGAFLKVSYSNDTRNGVIESFPTGLKVVAGPIWRGDFSDDVAFDKAEHSNWGSEGDILYSGTPKSGAANKVAHRSAAYFMRVEFPSCWDGQRLDSLKDLSGNVLPAEKQHRDHVRYGAQKTCTGAFADDIPDDKVRTLPGLSALMHYNQDYKDSDGNTVRLKDDHVYWFGLASRSEVPADQCDANGIPLTGRASSKKECWIKSFAECPTALGGNPKTCDDSNSVYPYDLADSAQADYFFGWDPQRLDFLTHICLNRQIDCRGIPGTENGQSGMGKDFPPAGPNCSDGLDNDGDGKIDWRADGSGDPDCSTPADNTESADSAGRTLYFKATPDHVPPGSLATLTWSAERLSLITQECEPSGDWSGHRLSGGQTVTSKLDGPPGTVFKFNLVCDPDNLATDPLDDTTGLNQTVTVTLGEAPPDTTPPDVPTGLVSTGTTTTTISLAWNASDDHGGTGVAGYRIYRNGSLVTSTALTSYTDSGLSSDTSYSYTVAAYDNASPPNVSAQSSSVSARTSAEPITPPPSQQFPVGDLNQSGHVDVIDLSILLSHYGASGGVGDIDGQNGVSVIDLSILLTHYER